MEFEDHYRSFRTIYDSHLYYHSRKHCATRSKKKYSLLKGEVRDYTNLSYRGIADLICDLRKIVIQIMECIHHRHHYTQITSRQNSKLEWCYDNCTAFLAATESYVSANNLNLEIDAVRERFMAR